ncbi:MAG TPA: efflux RND transporter periplasmic adaptor subunit [Planctomycetota bacterium]|jgi:multidrug efflux system membrane fusion protein
MRVVGILVLLGALGIGGWYLVRQSASAVTNGSPPKNGAAAGSPAAISVVALPVGKKDVPVYLDGLGTVQAYNTVTIHTQIDGQLSRVLFKEGQDVHKGDLLAEIDARIYQAQLDQAQAKKTQDQAKVLQDRARLQQDQAKKAQDEANTRQAEAKKAQDQVTLANDRVNLKRNEDAYKAAAVSEQLVTDQAALVKQLEATVQGDDAAIQAFQAGIQADSAALKSDEAALTADDATIQADEAAIRYAQTFLSYTTINSPIDGRTGVRLMDAGNIVHVNDPKGLVVITQLEPISIVFTLPQQHLNSITTRMAQETLPVIAFDSDTKKELDRGTLQLIDNQIDPTTGTIQLKTTFPNAHRTLWPGGYVNVRLLLETRQGASVIPATTVQQGPNGPYVFIVKEDETVDMRPIAIALIQDGQAVLASGLAPGEMVVVSGQDRLRVGTKVTLAKPQKPGGAGASSAGVPEQSGGAAKPSGDEPRGERRKKPSEKSDAGAPQ